MFRKPFLITFLFLLLPLLSYAHPLDVVYSEMFVVDDHINYSIKFSSLHLVSIVGLESVEELNKEEIDVQLIRDYFDENLIISDENRICHSSLKKIILDKNYNINPQSSINIYFNAVCKEKVEYFEISTSLFSNYPYPKILMMDVYYNNETTNFVKNYNEKTFLPVFLEENVFEKQSESKNFVRALNFIKTGIHHIFIGYDHIAFIIGIVIIILSFKQAVKIVTAFTIAHSITLILSALDIIVIQQSIAELIIALSIAYIGFENLYSKKIKKRWAIAFIFGLFHGFGFSAVLKEIGLPKGFEIISLLSFNVGVEIGQLAIVGLIIPMMLYFKKYSWFNSFKSFSSGIIFSLGIFWFITGLFFFF